jgi:hypothetical protein
MQGHIRKRVHRTKSGRQTVTWYVVIDLPRNADGKRRQKWHGGFRTRREAEAERAKIVHEFNTGTYVEPSSTTFFEWVHEQWLPTIQSRVKPSTFDSYQRNLRLHVLPRLGSRQIRHLTPAILKSAVCTSRCRGEPEDARRPKCEDHSLHPYDHPQDARRCRRHRADRDQRCRTLKAA